MNLIPQPKSIILHDGVHYLHDKSEIYLKNISIEIAEELKAFILEHLGFETHLGINSTIVFEYGPCDELYELRITKDHIRIKSRSSEGIFYGLQTLKQLIALHGRRLPCLHIKDSPVFDNRGYYYDVTRGKVPTLDYLKQLVDTMAYFKLNQLQLYVEHTYLFKNQSEVWTTTDPLTAEEIMLLDDYCAKKHIELVPSIATFGHLYEALQTESFKHLSELEPLEGFSWEDRMSHHTLNVSLDESLIFVQKMIDEFVLLVRSDHFNICADETFDLGEGKNKNLADQVGKSSLYVTFLNKIIHHVQSHGKKVMFWGDIILKHPEHVDALPKDVICLNWWYWMNYPEAKVSGIADKGFKQYLCPGVNGWNTLINDYEMAYNNIKMMTSYAKKYDAIGILNTDWGDYGHWNSFSCSIPGMIYGAAFSWGDERTQDAMNESIDALVFRANIMPILMDISKVHVFTLLPLVQWFEKNDTTYLERIDISKSKCIESLNRLEDLRFSLLDMLAVVPYNTREHIRTYIVAADGVRLFNSLYMEIYDHLYDKKYKQGVDRKELASALEYWLLDFKNLWYKVNKYSEMYRIVEFIKTVTLWLRRL